ncbi:MAG: hypothetical protein ACRD5H_19040, partial [Nitrososphaerales archaeon]
MTQITDEVIVVTDVKASASEEFTVHLAPIKSCVKLEYSYKSTNGNALRIAFNKAQALYDAISRHRPHHVYVPYADGVTQVLGLCRLVKNNILTKGEIEIEGLLMGGRFAYPREHWYDLFFNQARITATELSPFHIIHHLDPIPFEALKKRGGKLAKISRLVPEPVEPIIPIASAEARRILGIPVDGRYIGCVGVLEGYKGIDRILRAFAEAKLEAVDRLLFVGRLAEDVRKILTSELTPLVKGKRIIT